MAFQAFMNMDASEKSDDDDLINDFFRCLLDEEYSFSPRKDPQSNVDWEDFLKDPVAILLASGYLTYSISDKNSRLRLKLTNQEMRLTFKNVLFAIFPKFKNISILEH